MTALAFPRRGLYAITGGGLYRAERLSDAVGKAIAGGARVVQYRDKSEDRDKRRLEARALERVCHDSGVPLIINDDVDLAREIGADGVHLGRDDMALAEARDKLGTSAVIGISCYDRAELAVRAQTDGADYVAFGSFYPSSTKPAAVRADLGLLKSIRASIRVPVVCIGGITPENGAELVAAGGDLLAVVQGIFAQPDPCKAAQRYAALFTRDPTGNP